MNKLMIRLMLVLTLALVFSPLSAETPGELLDRLEKKSAALKSWEMTTEMTMKSEYIEMSSKSTMIAKRIDEKSIKMFMDSTSNSKMQGMPGEQKISGKMVSDGTVMWSESDAMGQKTVMKTKAQGDMTGNDALKDLLKGNNAVVKGKETINGQECSVIELSSDAGGETTTTTMWLSEKTGMMVKSETKGKSAGTTTLLVTDFKENPSIDDSKFNYTPPAGVEVVDMTNAGT